MAKKRKRKRSEELRRLTINFHPEVWRWFRRAAFRKGANLTTFVEACVASFYTLDESKRDWMMEWASLLGEDEARWADFEEWCKVREEEKAAALEVYLEAALSRASGEHYEQPEAPRAKKAGA